MTSDERVPKHPSIIEALDRLRGRFGAQAFQTVEHWDEDLAAVGIVAPGAPGRLVYICTAGRPPGRYDAVLELPPEPGAGSRTRQPASDRSWTSTDSHP